MAGVEVHRLARAVACVVLAGLMVVAASWWSAAGLFGRVSGLMNDVVFPRGEVDPSVLVLAIDRQALAAADVGWPWSRSVLAEVVTQLDEAGAAVVVLDLLFADATEDDDVLAEAMSAAGNVILSAAPLDIGGSDPGRPLRATVVVGPTGELEAAAAATGASVFVPDPADGVVRLHPLVIERPDLRTVPSVALAAVQVASADDAPVLLRQPGGVQVDDRVVPTDEHYQLRISWPHGLEERAASPGVRSVADLLDGTLDPSDVAGRVVFVGVTDPSLGDRALTPISGAAGTPGVIYHAAAYHTLASRQFLSPASVTEAVVWVFVAALLIGLATQFLPLFAAGVADVVIVLAVAVGVYVRMDQGVLMDAVDPLAAAILTLPLSGAVRHLGETRQRQRVSRMFSEYVPAPVAAQLLRDGSIDGAVEGQRLEVSLLFCDLRGFTPLAAARSPAEVRRLLSVYYEYVSELILSHDGTVVQYVGDEVFSVFGAPVAQSDHASRAVETALELQRRRDRLWARLRGAVSEAPALEFGISVHTGVVVAAIAGSSAHRQYTIVGDPVNVGSRLCGQARAGEIVVSDAAMESAGLGDLGQRFSPDLAGVARRVPSQRISVLRRPRGSNS